jgi:hypothetical protein
MKNKRQKGQKGEEEKKTESQERGGEREWRKTSLHPEHKSSFRSFDALSHPLQISSGNSFAKGSNANGYLFIKFFSFRRQQQREVGGYNFFTCQYFSPASCELRFLKFKFGLCEYKIVEICTAENS